MKTISVSKIFTFNTCLRKYFYIYVEKIKRPPVSKMIFGTANHTAQEYASNEQIAGKSRPKPKEQVEVFMDKLERELKEDVIMDPGDSRGKLQDDGLKTVTDYDTVIGHALKPVATELSFELSFSGVDWKINGRIDLVTVDDVIDLKFGRYHKTGDEPEFSTQLIMYNYARKMVQKDDTNKCMKIHSVRRGATRNGVKDVDVIPSISEVRMLSNVAETARAIIAAEKSGDFPSTYQQRVCSWCQYRDLCGLSCK